MDLDAEERNKIRPSVCRVSMKLLSLQRLCHLDLVSIQHIMASVLRQEVMLNREEVTCTLNRMFVSVSQEVSSHVTEETSDLLMRHFNWSGSVSAASIQTALIALSSDDPLNKYRALLSVSGTRSGSISRSGLRSLLQDLSQVPAAVQEGAEFGGVDGAVTSCFDRVLTTTASEEHVLSWLQSEPHMLLWLPTMYRLSVSQNVSHSVRCHTCKTRPFTGLRYRCLKCANVHVCQSCFLSERQSRKHKTRHPVLEFCSQPSWRESLYQLVHSVRLTLLPRRHTQRVNEIRRWAEPGETQTRAPPPSEASVLLVDSAVHHIPLLSLSKALQTDEDTPPQQASALTADVRNLQRDKWLLEKEMQAWQLTVQSDQSILEDRCLEMEVTMETLRQQNSHLQEMFSQALDKIKSPSNAKNTPHSGHTDEVMSDTPRTSEDEEEDEVVIKDEWHEDEKQTPRIPSHGDHCEEEGPVRDGHFCRPIASEDGPAPGTKEQDTCLSEEVEEYGMCSPEDLVLETVDRLKCAMETWRERETGETKRADLLEAADHVQEAIHNMVDVVLSNTH